MNIKWQQIKSPDYKLIYPDYFAPTAVAMSGFLDSITPYIGYGFTKKPQRIPIILHTENFRSNGEVVWAPKRMELMTSSPPDTYADPWLKQLAVHEARHVVQLSALRGGLTKVASVLFGQAGMGLGMLCVTKWFLEGDATMAETQFSEYGRGLQPSFNVDLRGMLIDEKSINISTDKWVCGSYKVYTPGIYSLGYHIVAAGERYHGPEMWGRAVEYAGKYPIMIVPMRIFLRREFGTGVTPLARRALSDLRDWWAPYTAMPNNYVTFTTPSRSHTTYGHAVIDSSGAVIATKSDFDTPTQIVSINPVTGHEKHLMWSTTPSSRPIIHNNKLYWTEYKPHPIWEYKNYSIIRELDLATGKRAKYGSRQTTYFVTPIGTDRFACVSPDSLGGSDLLLRDGRFRMVDKLRLGGLTSLHGLAWDSTTRTLAMILLDERGMWLGAVTPQGDTLGEIRPLTQPSMVSLSSLTASNGSLYFGSIASGKDEVHTLSLLSGVEQRLTTSSLGAYAPAVRDTAVVINTYTPRGMMLGMTSTSTIGCDTVQPSRLPSNILNIPGPKWKVPKMAEMPMDDTVTTHKTRRYNKALRWFNVHSWAPIAVDIDKLIDEHQLNMGFGMSLFFQSAMGDSYGSATYGWLNRSNWVSGSFTYAGLPVTIGIEADYGGGKQGVYIPVDNMGDVTVPDNLQNYFRTSMNIGMPLNFSGGANLRLLQPSVSITHYNALLYNSSGEGGFDRGYQKYNFSLLWSNNRRASLRSITPRWGYAIRADVSGAFGSRFGTVYSLYARGYLPGFMKNHSITLRFGTMYQTLSELNFNQKPLVPRGTNNNYGTQRYAAASVDYSFPAFYPDGGINGVIYFKRIWFNVFGDYAIGDYFAPGASTRTVHKYSYGGDIAIDINLLSTETPFTFKFTLAGPSDNKFFFGVGLAFKL